MPRNIYSTRFILGFAYAAGGFAQSYTVPAGKVAIVNFVQTASGIAGTVSRVGILPVPGSAEWVVQRFTAVSADVPQQWVGRIVLYAGDILRVTNQTAGTTVVNCHASGYLLTA